jgi:hypothetical protein
MSHGTVSLAGDGKNSFAASAVAERRNAAHLKMSSLLYRNLALWVLDVAARAEPVVST